MPSAASEPRTRLAALLDESAPVDSSQTKLGKLLSAGPKKSRLAALLDEGQGQGSEGIPPGPGSANGGGPALQLPGLGPVPNPLALLQQGHGIPGLETGAQIADVVSNIPHIIGETIRSTGRALPEVPRETLRIAQAMAGGQTIPVDIIKAQAEDVMQAQQGNQEAQDRINARSLIQSTVLAPIAGAAGAGAPALSATQRMLLGGGLGAAQNVALAGAEGRAPSPVDIGAGFAFGALPAHGPTPVEPIPGIRPAAVISAETKYAADNLLEKLASAKPIIGEQRLLRKRVLGERLSKASEAAQGLTGEARLKAELGQLKGPLPRSSIEPLNLSPEDRTQLFTHLENLQETGQLKQFQGVNARRALQRLLGDEASALPRPHEIKLLRQAFGAKFAMQLANKGLEVAEATQAKNLPQWRSIAKEISGSARELKTTFDLSFPFRQGWFLMSHPREFAHAFGEMHKYAFNREYYENSMAHIMDRPTFPLMQDAGVKFSSPSGHLQAGREEIFQGGLLRNLPRWIGGGLIRGSERAYTGMGNVLRADVFDDMLRQGTKLGLTPQELAPHVGNFVNVATGRGELPTAFGIDKASELLGHALFAPGLISSRIQLLGTPISYLKSLASGDKAYRFVRQQAMKDWLVMGGMASTMLGLAAAAGSKVQRNPTHGDYGKARVGNQTMDFLAGHGQFIRSAARIYDEMQYHNLTGKKGAQGNVAMRLARSKESPIAQFINDGFLQEDYQGNKVTWPSALMNLILPLSLSDAWSAIQDNPRTAAVTVPLSMYGVSFQKYKEPKPYKPGGKGY